eukprot:3590099-Amphidinium_carterae.1
MVQFHFHTSTHHYLHFSVSTLGVAIRDLFLDSIESEGSERQSLKSLSAKERHLKERETILAATWAELILESEVWSRSESMTELSDCYLFGYAFPLTEGDVLQVTWKAWRSGGALGLKLELRRILPDLGFEYTSAGTKVCKQWKRLYPVWKGLAESLGMKEVESMLGAPSTFKYAQSASSSTADVETSSERETIFKRFNFE